MRVDPLSERGPCAYCVHTVQSASSSSSRTSALLLGITRSARLFLLLSPLFFGTDVRLDFRLQVHGRVAQQQRF